MHTDDDRPAPPLSRQSRQVMELLVRRGGTLRMCPLLEAAGLDADALAAAVNELATRGWVKVVWRGPEARRPETLPERLREVVRIVATRFGRWRHRATWWM
jgi:hypothetical protein